jgi:dihydrofolate synthase/folylpolyglutamate synthase
MNADSKKYDTTINYLYGLQKHGIKLGLENTKKIMDVLGDPYNSFHSVHIAGTNGKGSTSTAIASILQENGLRVGLFTSPHLVSFTERIRINNICIEESEVIETASLIRDAISGTDFNPTFFEFVTAMAFHYFSKNEVDWAVVETGMGGRLDATNIIRPNVSVITNISLDHCEFLGNDISDIIHEKAGIIKQGIPVVTSAEMPEAVKQLTDIAEERGSEIHVFGKDFHGSLLKMDEKRIYFDYAGYKVYKGLSMSLTGRHQLYNACTAIRVGEVLRNKGFFISDGSIKEGLFHVELEGRLEQVSKSPHIIVDGAHNPEAAHKLAGSVRDLFPNKKIILIIGIMDDKDAKGVLQPLIEIAESVILTKPGYERAASPGRLAEIARDLTKSRKVHVTESITETFKISDALGLAKRICREDNIILVAGSFYTAGEAKQILGCKGALTDLQERIKDGN